jgi:hypothetical protein
MSDYDIYTESDGEVLPEVLEHFPADAPYQPYHDYRDTDAMACLRYALAGPAVIIAFIVILKLNVVVLSLALFLGLLFWGLLRSAEL